MHNLAVLYAEGVNGAPDYASAASWFRTAAEHGVKDSQFNIAILHVRGLGVAQDMGEAYKWFAAAAAQGDPDAVKKRDEVAARLPADKLADVKATFEAFRAKKPDPRANDVAIPEGGWDQTAAKAPVAATTKKTRT
jgi:localization factor PodJL